jgi:hypothetical protein
VTITITDSEIEATAREWRKVWVSDKGSNDQSWQALVRHVLTQAAPKPEDVEEVKRVVKLAYDAGWENQKDWLARVVNAIIARYGAPPPIASAKPEDVRSIRIIMNNVSEQGDWPSGRWMEEAARRIIERYGPPQPIAAPIRTVEIRDAETLARDWYECRYEHSAWKSAGYDARRDHLETATRFLTLPHRARSPLPVGTIVVGEGLTEEQEAWPAEKKRDEAVSFEKASQAIFSFRWSATIEGTGFWRDLHLALNDRATALCASAAPKQPEPVTVVDFTVSGSTDDPNFIAVYRDYAGDTLLNAPEARALAAALIAKADEAEAP